MARKSLISPGSILPERAADPESDTMMSRILQRDRVQSGRPAPEEATGIAEDDFAESNITDNITAHTESHTSAQKTEQPTAQADAPPRNRNKVRPAKMTAVVAPPSNQVAQEAATRMRRSRLIPMTLRIPEELNDWLDEYAHRHRKEGIKKQDLIARAVELLYIEVAQEEGQP